MIVPGSIAAIKEELRVQQNIQHFLDWREELEHSPRQELETIIASYQAHSALRKAAWWVAAHFSYSFELRIRCADLVKELLLGTFSWDDVPKHVQDEWEVRLQQREEEKRRNGLQQWAATIPTYPFGLDMLQSYTGCRYRVLLPNRCSVNLNIPTQVVKEAASTEVAWYYDALADLKEKGAQAFILAQKETRWSGILKDTLTGYPVKVSLDNHPPNSYKTLVTTPPR